MVSMTCTLLSFCLAFRPRKFCILLLGWLKLDSSSVTTVLGTLFIVSNILFVEKQTGQSRNFSGRKIQIHKITKQYLWCPSSSSLLPPVRTLLWKAINYHITNSANTIGAALFIPFLDTIRTPLSSINKYSRCLESSNNHALNLFMHS